MTEAIKEESVSYLFNLEVKVAEPTAPAAGVAVPAAEVEEPAADLQAGGLTTAAPRGEGRQAHALGPSQHRALPPGWVACTVCSAFSLRQRIAHASVSLLVSRSFSAARTPAGDGLDEENPPCDEVRDTPP